MALVQFIPQNVVQALILDELRKKMVFGSLITIATPANLGRGGSYQIPGLGDIDIGDYSGIDITTQSVDDIKKTLTVDQAKYFSFYYDKVDNAKAAYSVLSRFGEKGAYELANTLDAYIAGLLGSEATNKETAALGSLALPVSLTASNALDYVAEIKEVHDEQNAPQEGRFLVVPPFMASVIAQTNIETASTTSEAARSTGWISNYLGYNMYMSNNLPKKVQAVLTFDADFVASNTINGTVNAVAWGEVTYATSHAATATALLAALNAVTGVTATKDSTGRIYTIYSGALTNVVTAVVAAGATQAGAVITYPTNTKTGIETIAGIKSSFVLASVLDEFEMFDKTEKRFAELMKGLSVYGGLTVTPDAVVRGVVSKG